MFDTILTSAMKAMPVFATHFGVTLLILICGVLIYRAVTPQDETRLIHENNVAAAVAFGAAILSLALPLFFLNYALTHQVIGWDGQRAYLSIAAAALVANIAANLMLVPTRGIAGAAIATVVTEIVVTAGCAYVLWRRTVGGETAAGLSRGSRSSAGVEP